MVENGGEEMARSMWQKLVSSEAAIYQDHKIFLIVDGLNKINPAESTKVITALKEWAHLANGNVKICISSCGEKVFQEALGSSPGYNLDKVNFINLLWLFQCMEWLVAQEIPFFCEHVGELDAALKKLSERRWLESCEPRELTLTPSERDCLKAIFVDMEESQRESRYF
ncbi:uncharacterized protein BO97DRAFT_447012 [Aspergillus homomorphus CBS 101889]|uniref:Uncharacterized protein n=1 Tax=Aspergillus homomorphus (strain CBS 101889) TaxID=1450537 RepID=A0A395HHR1_ASPHC|nr:hypothetical protein BO97DRAFT_447012 [Aspergillus homomorphus CBS 101889]RAL07280.1 hypothetical protein BO97DRAFT_447012 [Aspergillus homomorphus CBS 101889]